MANCRVPCLSSWLLGVVAHGHCSVSRDRFYCISLACERIKSLKYDSTEYESLWYHHEVEKSLVELVNQRPSVFESLLISEYEVTRPVPQGDVSQRLTAVLPQILTLLRLLCSWLGFVFPLRNGIVFQVPSRDTRTQKEVYLGTYMLLSISWYV